MKFIEIAEGFSLRVDSIVSVKTQEDGVILIQTEDREYKVRGDFSLLMNALEEEDRIRQRTEKMATQFFGG